MPSVAVDSSFLYALFEPKDRAHAGATRVLDTYRGDLVVNLPVLTEVAYLLDYSARAQSALLQFAARVSHSFRDRGGSSAQQPGEATYLAFWIASRFSSGSP